MGKTFDSTKGFITFSPSAYFMQEQSLNLTIIMNPARYIIDTSFTLESLASVVRVVTNIGGISLNFTVNILKDPVESPSAFITPSTIANQIYTRWEPELAILFDDFYFNVTECTDITFTYSVSVNGSSTLASFIDYDSDLRTIWVIS